MQNAKNNPSGLVLSFDIGGTKTAYALVNNFGEIVGEVEKIKTPSTKESIEQTLTNIIFEYKNKIDNISLATAGAVNNENTAVIGSTANLPEGYSTIDFQKIASSINKKIFIENDANAAAWAEYRLGASKNTSNSIMLTLGTGVGGGIIINNKLLKGKSGAAGEMHFPLSRKKERKCTCSNYDCFEIYASGNGLRLTGIEVFNDNSITTYDIIEKAQKNDTKALLAFELWQNDIIEGIRGLANLFDPECVVLSGSMGEFCNVEKIEEEVNKRLVSNKNSRGDIKVYHAKLKNHAGLVGAALLAQESVL